MSFMEVITNKYIISTIGAVLALLFTYMYDKFERKDYSYLQYVKMAVVGYIVSLISVIVSGYAMCLEGTDFPLPFANSVGITSSPSSASIPVQSGGGTNVPQTGSASVDSLKPVNLPQSSTLSSPSQSIGNVNVDALDFRTGTPTF